MRHQIQSQEEYDSAITRLAEEFSSEIKRGRVHNVATQLIAGWEIVDGKPAVCDTPNYAGGPVTSIDSRFYPLTVLEFTRADRITPLSSRRTHHRPSALQTAVKALQADLLSVLKGEYGGVTPCEEPETSNKADDEAGETSDIDSDDRGENDVDKDSDKTGDGDTDENQVVTV